MSVDRTKYKFGDFELDPSESSLLRSGVAVPITPKALSLLSILVKNQGNVLDKAYLLDHVWADSFVEEGNLTFNIRQLRKILGDEVKNPKFLETVPKRGYRFIAEVQHHRDLSNAQDSNGAPPDNFSAISQQVSYASFIGREIGEKSEGQSDSAEQPAESQGQLGAWRWQLAGLVITVLVLFGGFFGYRYFTAAKQIESIAVMPFTNDSGNADLEYLSDGMTETLIGGLTQLSNLTVKARSSVFRYKGKETDAKTVGKELNVQAILNGRVAQRGEHLTFSLELVDTATENAIWSNQYTRKQSDLVSLQNEIARDVSAKLRVKISGAEEQNLLKTYTTNPEAYQLYLRGRHEWNKFSLDGLTRSLSFFERAIEIDPNYALAYSGIADSYVNLGIDFMSPKEAMPKAKIAAMKALALDDSLAEAHSSLGSYKLFYEWDDQGAERDYLKAIALDPNYANAHHFYSHCLQFSGRVTEAMVEIKRAVELEPLSALNNAEFAWAFYLARQYDASIEQSLKTLELEPGFAYGYFVIGLAYNAKGMYPEAVAALEKGQTLSPDWLELQGLLAYTHASAGDRKRAQAILSKALTSSAGGYINEVVVASVYAALGDNDQAIAWLERGYQERCSWMKWISIEPNLEKLRPDPRFKELVRRVGI